MPVTEALTCQQENMEIPLLLQRITPIPRARQPPINTTTRIIEIISTRSIKPMTEKISKDLPIEIFHRSKLLFDVGPQRRYRSQFRNLREGVAYREQDTINLGVLVDEHERVGYVVIAHVYNAGAYPRPHAPLRFLEYSLHHSRCFWCRLDAVKSLACIAESVCDVFG